MATELNYSTIKLAHQVRDFVSILENPKIQNSDKVFS